VHTCHVGAEAIEVHAEIVAGVKRSEAAIQCGERSAGISSGWWLTLPAIARQE
jgi:hypothetical protein